MITRNNKIEEINAEIQKAETLKYLSQAKPFIWSGVALLIFLTRTGELSIGECYGQAKQFINRLTMDVRGDEQ